MVEITAVELIQARDGNVCAYGQVTLGDEWIIRDMRVIERPDGSRFVAMPCEEFTEKCPKCRCVNRASSNYCNGCGTALTPQTLRRFRDLAFPVNARVRRRLEERILETLRQLEKCG